VLGFKNFNPCENAKERRNANGFVSDSTERHAQIKEIKNRIEEWKRNKTRHRLPKI
jgi:hypothetical protein